MWDFLVLFLCLAVEGPIVGFSLHNMMQMVDLEYDIVNPHDAARTITRSAAPLLYLHLGITALTLLSRRFYLFVPAIACTLLFYRSHVRGLNVVSPTDIYRDIKPIKRRTILRLFFHVVFFCFFLFALIFHIVITLDSDHAEAAQMLKEAAASLP